ncbi:MAG: hypothetical protein HZA62_00320 [Rhodocyclales bacterium]|nr:hypothetical protein [Rhodocyclales bacterium]
MDRDHSTRALIANLRHNHDAIRGAIAEAVLAMERAAPICPPRDAATLHSDCTLAEIPQAIDLFNGAVKMRAIHENNEMHLLDVHYPHHLVAALAETDWAAKQGYRQANEIFARDFHVGNPDLEVLKQEILGQFHACQEALDEHMRLEEEHWRELGFA